MPEWLSIKNKPGKPLPTRTIIKNHLKEWNTDKIDKEYIRDVKESLEDEKGRKVSMKEAKSYLGEEDFKENRRARKEAKEHFERTGER